MTRKVALLRAVNVGGNKLPMATLRALCTVLGWLGVETLLQSGNLLFEAPGTLLDLERQLEDAIAERLGFATSVMVRDRAQWAEILSSNPFVAEARSDPARLLLHVPKAPPVAGAETLIASRAADGEQVKRSGDVLWIHYPSGSGRSRLSPSFIDKAIGSPSTSRNHRTVTALRNRLGQ
jgi:uncharacterized protein (DUF1697 family)